MFDGDSTVEFGPHTIGWVSLPDINVIEQIRKSYPPEQISALAESIEVVGDDDDQATGFNLANPVAVAKLTPDHATRYIEEHADFYGQDAPTDVQAADDGYCSILIAGHRRRMAIKSLVEKHELDPSAVVIASSLHDNISFEDALALQVRENTYEKVPAHEEAKNIQLYYNYLQNKSPNKRVTFRQVAAHTGRSESTVSQALSFMTLPDSIQDYVANNALPYTTVASLKPLMEAYDEYYVQKNDSQDPDSKDDYIETSLIIMANNLCARRLEDGASSSKVQELIKAKITSLRESKFTSEPLFVIEKMPLHERLQRSRLGLGRSAVTALEIAHPRGQNLGESEITRLEQLLAGARASHQVDQSELF